MQSKCTTHHHACDCREKRIRELIEWLVECLADEAIYVEEEALNFLAEPKDGE